jgi:hypothetical protein
MPGRKLIDRTCDVCGKPFKTDRMKIRHCSATCRREQGRIAAAARTTGPRAADNCTTGAAGAGAELVVSARLLFDGWHVFRALSPNGPVDLIAVKDGCLPRYLEVRCGSYYGDTLTFPRGVRVGSPAPTEFAVYVHATGQVLFVPVSETVRTTT